MSAMELWPVLDKTAKELMVFNQPRNENLMDEIFKFDPRNLEATSSAKISQYAIGLAQFLIFFSSQVNKKRVLLMQKNRVLEVYVNKSSDVKGRTKAERMTNIISANPELSNVKEEMELLECELGLTENLEKYFLELINTFKRELTRRDVEFKLSRDERRL